MGAVIAIMVWISWAAAQAILWVLYFVAVGLFYLLAALFNLVVEGVRWFRNRPRKPSEQQVAHETSAVVMSMYDAADRARERVRNFAA